MFIFWKTQEAGQIGRQEGKPRRRSKKRLPAVLFIVSLSAATTAAYAQSTQWDSILSNSNWYVPVPGLIAYGSGNVSFYQPPPIAFGDQTLWALGTATNGVFTGQSNAVFDINGISSTSAQSMQGVVLDIGPDRHRVQPARRTEHDRHRPDARDRRRAADGNADDHRLELLVTHWAYMTPYNPAVFTPPSPSQSCRPNVTSPQWRWTAGTTWRDQPARPCSAPRRPAPSRSPTTTTATTGAWARRRRAARSATSPCWAR